MLADEEWVQLYSHMCLLSVLVSAPPKKDSDSAHAVAGMQHNLDLDPVDYKCTYAFHGLYAA